MSNHQTTDASATPESPAPGPAFWSIPRFAKHLGVAPQYLYTLKDIGRLRVELIEGRYLIPADVAHQFETQRNARRTTREETHREETGS